jgi:hypothetical protein
VSIDGEEFCINGRPTYEGVSWRGRRVQGLLMNSRMVHAIFDDENPQTRGLWAYPDTGVWDAERNTREFCAALPEYRAHGLLAVTVGLQGGGSIYRREVYDAYECSAFAPDGSLRPAYFERLRLVLEAADAAGLVVIVNYFYWKHSRRFESEAAVMRAATGATEWLLATGYENILVDVANECEKWFTTANLRPEGIHETIRAVQAVTCGGRRLLVGASTCGGEKLPTEAWLEAEDFSMPHGNGLQAWQLADKLRRLRERPAYRRRARPVLVNEDSIFIENLCAAVDSYASWGLYSQGYGSGYKDRMDWSAHEREREVSQLSGYQTLPVNWGINTPDKAMFFQAVREITRGTPA